MTPADIEDVGTGVFRDDRDIFLCSIAVSLKRIADAMNERDPYANPIAQAIQGGLNLGAQDWIGHMIRSGR